MTLAARLSVAAVALGAVACDREARVEFSISEYGRVTADLYHIAASDGRHGWTFSGSDLRPGGTSVRTAMTGTLVVAYHLGRDPARQAAEGRFELELRPDWVWSVSFRPLDRDPTAGCFGCLHHFVFPLPDELRDSEADSMHVVVGGNSISRPVVY